MATHKYSKRSILKEAYIRKWKRKKHKKDLTEIEENDIFNDGTYNNTLDKINPLLSNLYFFINGRKPTKKERDFKINEITKSVILALMTMDSGKENTFISKLLNERYDEITAENKLDYLHCIYKELINVNFTPSQKYLHDYYGYMQLSKDTDYAEMYKKHMQELLDKQFTEIEEDLLLEGYENKIMQEIDKMIKCAIGQFYIHNNAGGIVYPSEYTFSSANDIYQMLKTDDVYVENSLSLLDREEKRQLLDMLCNDVYEAVDKWKCTASKFLDEKIYDSTVTLEDII